MLYLIGLGLGDAKDITVKGLEIVKKADQVFLEAYTSILRGGKEELVCNYSLNYDIMDKYLYGYIFSVQFSVSEEGHDPKLV